MHTGITGWICTFTCVYVSIDTKNEKAPQSAKIYSLPYKLERGKLFAGFVELVPLLYMWKGRAHTWPAAQFSQDLAGALMVWSTTAVAGHGVWGSDSKEWLRPESFRHQGLSCPRKYFYLIVGHSYLGKARMCCFYISEVNVIPLPHLVLWNTIANNNNTLTIITLGGSALYFCRLYPQSAL